MYSDRGYLSMWLGIGRGALIQTPGGALYHVAANGKPTRLQGQPEAHARRLANIEQVKGEWRNLQVTNAQRAICQKMGITCPTTQGAAVEKIAHVLARIAVREAERVQVVELPAEPVAKPVMELSDEMTAEQFAAYLKAHPGIEKTLKAAA